MIKKYPLAEITAILYSLQDIPPMSLKSSLTEDGQKLWDNCRYEHDVFYQELEAYFKGLPSQLDQLENDNWRNYFDCKRRWFLALYQVIRVSWKHLEPFHYDESGNELTPGLLVSKIIEVECFASLLPTLEDHCEIVPRRLYDLESRIAKAIHQNTIDQLFKEIREENKTVDKLAIFRVIVLSYCRGNKKDNLIARALNDYESVASELSDLTRKVGNFRRTKKQTWIDGEKHH